MKLLKPYGLAFMCIFALLFLGLCISVSMLIRNLWLRGKELHHDAHD